MPLHLVEVFVDVHRPEDAKALLAVGKGIAEGRLPPGTSWVAGPWISNEEGRLLVVLDIPDHSATAAHFWQALTNGVVRQRRLTPLIDLHQLEAIVDKL